MLLKDFAYTIPFLTAKATGGAMKSYYRECSWGAGEFGGIHSLLQVSSKVS